MCICGVHVYWCVYGVVWCGVVWCGVVWCGVVCVFMMSVQYVCRLTFYFLFGASV